MNSFSPIVEQVLKEYTNQALLSLTETLFQSPGPISNLFDCPLNIQYVLKRLIGGCLAKDPEIKFNAFTGLTVISNNKITINESLLVNYILQNSNHKKHCGGKRSEMQSYAIGKILIFKAIAKFVKNNQEVVKNLIELVQDFPQLQEHILEVIYLLAHDKKNKLALIKMVLSTKSGFVMQQVFTARLKKIVPNLNQNVVNELLQESIKQYPRKSLALTLVGQQLKNFLTSPAEYFTSRINPFLKQEQQFDFKFLFYLLHLIKAHLKNTLITMQNFKEMISVEMLKTWFEQMRVKNKVMKNIIEGFKIQFEQNPSFSFLLISKFHSQGLYLQNISTRHPLAPLYANVEISTFFQYLVKLCNEDLIEMQSQKQQYSNHFVELEYIVSSRFDQLSIDQIGISVSLFLKRYHKFKAESHLNSISNILNIIFVTKKSKKISLNTKAATILSKIDLSQIEIQENINQICNASKEIRLAFKQQKDINETSKIVFLNFILATVYYFLVYPEEADTYLELKMVQNDLKNCFFYDEVKDVVKKKQKKQKDEEDPKKPIHVLVDIFLSLLTKSPQFLRSGINLLFEALIPLLETSDLSQILEVIQRPDQEYIQQI